MQKVGCMTTFLHSINATRESNESGRFSARLGHEIENVDFLGNSEIFKERKRMAFLLLLRPTYMQSYRTIFEFCGHLLLKARANARNIVGPNILRAFAHHVVCCCVLLQLVGSSWMKFETGQTSEPTSANISIVSRSSKRGPTMLRSLAQHI